MRRRGFAVGEHMEARVRIELTYKGFADLSLTTWVPRHLFHYKQLIINNSAGRVGVGHELDVKRPV